MSAEHAPEDSWPGFLATTIGFIFFQGFDKLGVLDERPNPEVAERFMALSSLVDGFLDGQSPDGVSLRAAGAIASTCREARVGASDSLVTYGGELMRAATSQLVTGVTPPRAVSMCVLREAFKSPALRATAEDLKATVAKPLLALLTAETVKCDEQLQGGRARGARCEQCLCRLRALRALRAVHDVPTDPSVSKLILEGVASAFLGKSQHLRKLLALSDSAVLGPSGAVPLGTMRFHAASANITQVICYSRCCCRDGHGKKFASGRFEMVALAVQDLLTLTKLALIEGVAGPVEALTEVFHTLDLCLTLQADAVTYDLKRLTSDVLGLLLQRQELGGSARADAKGEDIPRDLVRVMCQSDKDATLAAAISATSALCAIISPKQTDHGAVLDEAIGEVAVLLLEAQLVKLEIKASDAWVPFHQHSLATWDENDFLRLQLRVRWSSDLNLQSRAFFGALANPGAPLLAAINGALERAEGGSVAAEALSLKLWIACLDHLSDQAVVLPYHWRFFKFASGMFGVHFGTRCLGLPPESIDEALLALESQGLINAITSVFFHTLAPPALVATIANWLNGNAEALAELFGNRWNDLMRLLWQSQRVIRIAVQDEDSDDVCDAPPTWKVDHIMEIMHTFAALLPRGKKKASHLWQDEAATSLLMALDKSRAKEHLQGAFQIKAVEILTRFMLPVDGLERDVKYSDFPSDDAEGLMALLRSQSPVDTGSVDWQNISFDYESLADLVERDGDHIELRDVVVHIVAHQVLYTWEERGVSFYGVRDSTWSYELCSVENIDALLALVKSQRPSSRLAALSLLFALIDDDNEPEEAYSWEDGNEPVSMLITRIVCAEELMEATPRIRASSPGVHVVRVFLAASAAAESMDGQEYLMKQIQDIFDESAERREKIMSRRKRNEDTVGDPSRTAESAAAAEEALLEMLEEEEQEASKKQKKKQKKKAKKKAAAPVAAPAPAPAPPPAPASPAASSPDAESSASDDDDDLARLLPTRQPSAVQRPKRVAPVAPPAPRPAPAAPRPPPPPQPPKPAAVPRPEPPPSTLEQLLSRLKLGRYGKNFAAAEVTLDLLPLLTLEDYADVGLSRQDALKVRDAIAPPAPAPAVPAPAPQGDRHSGKILSWTQGDNYGFITPAGAGKAIFCHGSGLKGDIWTTPWKSVGARVTYLVGERRGRPIAVDVRFAGEAIPPPPARPAPPPRDDDVPEEFLCPITFDLMTDPVIAADGHTYERRAIEAWFSRARTSPVTNEPLEHLHLIPAHTIRSLIQRRFEAS